jgi:Glycosyl transferase family 2
VKIVAVMTMRNEVDIAAINLGYHRAAGVDEFRIVDNGSVDGTRELLETLASRHSWVTWRSDPGPFRQSEMATELAREAARDGADWVIAIDADEFWWTANGSLRDALDTGAGALVCSVETFVQSARVVHDHEASLATMRYRSIPKGRAEDARRLVEAGEIAFVEMTYPPKLALRPTSSLVIHTGNHRASGFEGPELTTSELVVLHAPLRARDRLAHRAERGRRIATVHASPLTAWHIRRVAMLEDQRELEGEWAANSHRHGALNVGGVKHPLLRDDRLRSAVLPFISQAARWRAPIRSRWTRTTSLWNA